MVEAFVLFVEASDVGGVEIVVVGEFKVEGFEVEAVVVEVIGFEPVKRRVRVGGEESFSSGNAEAGEEHLEEAFRPEGDFVAKASAEGEAA